MKDELNSDVRNIVFLGPSNSGKTHLITKYMPTWYVYHIYAVNYQAVDVAINNTSYRLWDISELNTNDYKKTKLPKFLDKADLMVLIFDINSLESLEKLVRISDHVVQLGYKSIPKILIANKCDLRKKRQLSTQEKSLIKCINSMSFIEVSSERPKDVNRVFSKLSEIDKSISSVFQNRFGFMKNGPAGKMESKKIVFLGGESSGKTTLIKRHVFKDTHVGKRNSTYIIRDAMYGKPYAFWDISSDLVSAESKFHIRKYLKCANLIVFVLDISDHKNIYKIQNLNLLVNLQGYQDVPKLIVATKVDKRISAVKNWVQTQEVRGLACHIGAKGYVECSAKLGEGVDAVFDFIAKFSDKPDEEALVPVNEIKETHSCCLLC